MNNHNLEVKEKARKEQGRRAIALAMESRWDKAVVLNRSILKEFPQDLEAYNRLGKALSELGRNRQAKEAFQRALELSPYNSIAKKNLDRLKRLGNAKPRASAQGSANPHLFIAESGKAGITSLTNLAPPDVLLNLAPGHPVEVQIEDGVLTIAESAGENVGQVEPKLASRLIRLIKGGNRYEATVTSVGEQELTVIIREVYRDPSQPGIVSFPSRGGANYQVYLPSTLLGPEVGEEGSQESEPVAVKDWSDDDTEPGDDEAFTPVFHRIIKAGEEGAEGAVDEGENF